MGRWAAMSRRSTIVGLVAKVLFIMLIKPGRGSPWQSRHYSTWPVQYSAPSVAHGPTRSDGNSEPNPQVAEPAQYAFQADDAGSIPVVRSSRRAAGPRLDTRM